MRKALCVGIDCYEYARNLHGCVNDAICVKNALERNGDGTLNFHTKLMCAASPPSYITRSTLKDAIQELFDDESEIALLYYAGHGSFDALGGYLITSETERADDGLSFDDIMGIVGLSKAKHKVIILDSCHSGFAASSKEMQNYSVLHAGTIILAYVINCFLESSDSTEIVSFAVFFRNSIINSFTVTICSPGSSVYRSPSIVTQHLRKFASEHNIIKQNRYDFPFRRMFAHSVSF